MQAEYMLETDLVEIIEPIIYTDNNDILSVKNIMLIDSNLFESQLFYNSVNTNTFPIIYSYTSQKKELLDILKNKFQNGVDRMSFVFHDPGNQFKPFLNIASFFEESDLLEDQTIFSENVTFLRNLINEFKIKNIDFLACNTLQYPKWQKYYKILTKLTNVICGASSNKTGNIYCGADWVMENTYEDVKNMYFSNSIDNYASTLAATTLTQNGGTIEIKQDVLGVQYKYAITGSDWVSVGNNFPIYVVNSGPSINNKLTIQFTTILSFNASLGSINAYFRCDSSCITFDGLNNNCIINSIQTYRGLIQNGTHISNGNHSIIVKNINAAITGSSTLFSASNDRNGWICQSNFGRNIKSISGFDEATDYILVDNCSNSGSISSERVGGICGENFCQNGVGSITNCNNSGSISGRNAGGICGAQAGQRSGNVSVTNCTNSGSISGRLAGGICGAQAGQSSGNVSVTNCTNSGSISGQYAGGICGLFAGLTSENVSVTNCTNSGSISGQYTGGILGAQAGQSSGNVSVTNCTNSGSISGSGTGGILGAFAGNFNGKITISKCFNLSNITGNYSGGITGYLFGYNTNQICSITNCYNIGTIGGTNSGGICGSDVGYNANELYAPIINITNCYTLGTIDTSCGGILGGSGPGVYTNIPTVTLTNCYTAGTFVDTSSGLISNLLSIKNNVIVNNCYIANANWSDTVANLSLIGNPLSNPSVGTTWSSIQINTPYLLSAYNNELYNPNSISTYSRYYTTSTGLQTNSTYSIINNEGNILPNTNITINSSNGIITYTNIKNTLKTYVVAYNSASTTNYYYGYNINSFTLTYAICFKEDTKILCLINNIETYIPIQEIKPGTLVKTYLKKENYVEVDTIGWFNLFNSGDNIRTEDSLYELIKEDYPCLSESLFLTGRHSILVDIIDEKDTTTKKFLKRKINDKLLLPCFVNKKAKVCNKNGLFKIWSFCLKSDDINKQFGVYANGLLVETTSKKYINSINLNIIK
jgi:hypothetical protein